MKQILILILCSLFAFEPVYGQRTKELKLTFDRSDFLIDESDGQLSISSAKHPIQYGADTSEPGLPYVIVHVLIGGDEEYSGVRIQSSEMPLYSDVFVRNNPTYRVRGSKEAKEPVKRVTSYTRALYPEENVRYTGTHNVDGYKYITFLVSPFKYQPGLRKLDLLHDISMSIQLKPSKTRVQKAGRAMRNVVKRVVVNGDEMQALYETPRVNYRNTFSRDIRSGNDPFDYLVITSESQKSAYQRLADWKTRKGVRTKVVTTEHIDSTFSSYTHDNRLCPPLAYKRAIKYYKDNYDIKYVLLGGDTEFIPSLICAIKPVSLKKHTPCDMYYACLSGESSSFEWNNHPDSLWGAYNVDIHPQVVLTRLSTNSLEDANMQTERIIEYEGNPIIEEWNDTMLMIACKIDRIYGIYSDAHIKDERIWDSIIHPIWDDGNRFRFFDTGTDHPNGATYDVTPEHFKKQIAIGYPFIHIDTHGNWNRLGMEDRDTLWSSEISDIKNSFYSIIVTSACTTNAIDSAECLSETLMRATQGNIIGYWGASRDTYGIDDERDLNKTDHVNMQFYRALFQNAAPRYGDIASITKIFYIDSIDNNEYRALLYDINPLGDAEMPIYTNQPKVFGEASYSIINDTTLSVSFTGMDSCQVCVMSLDDFGESYYNVDTVFVSPVGGANYVMNLSPANNYSICFTKPGYVPFYFHIYRNGYIQNETIDCDAFVLSNQVQIGRDVTQQKSEGPVLVKGKMVIKAPQGALIKNDFELQKGCTLDITP